MDRFQTELVPNSCKIGSHPPRPAGLSRVAADTILIRRNSGAEKANRQFRHCKSCLRDGLVRLRYLFVSFQVSHLDWAFFGLGCLGYGSPFLPGFLPVSCLAGFSFQFIIASVSFFS